MIVGLNIELFFSGLRNPTHVDFSMFCLSRLQKQAVIQPKYGRCCTFILPKQIKDPMIIGDCNTKLLLETRQNFHSLKRSDDKSTGSRVTYYGQPLNMTH